MVLNASEAWRNLTLISLDPTLQSHLGLVSRSAAPASRKTRFLISSISEPFKLIFSRLGALVVGLSPLPRAYLPYSLVDRVHSFRCLTHSSIRYFVHFVIHAVSLTAELEQLAELD